MLPVGEQGPLVTDKSSIAMCPDSPPTEASINIWWTSVSLTWLWANCHSFLWDPSLFHIYSFRDKYISQYKTIWISCMWHSKMSLTNVMWLDEMSYIDILNDPTVAPNMWYQNLKQYPSGPVGGERGDFKWAMSPVLLWLEPLMYK